MLNIHFSIKEEVLFLLIEGELTVDTINDFETVIRHELLHFPPIVAIDCKDLIAIDSTGLNHLIKFVRAAQEHDTRIFYLDVQPNIMQMFNFADLSRISTIMARDEFEEDYLSVPIS